MVSSYDSYVDVSESGTRNVLSSFIVILPSLKGKKILDVGCGTGLLTAHYTSTNDVTGIDSNVASLRRAAERGMKTRHVDLEKELDFPDHSFDLIVCKDVLEFVFNADQLVGEMRRVLKKDGTLILHVPNEFTVRDILSFFRGAGLLKKRWYHASTELDNPHIRFFTEKGLIASASKSGLRFVESRSSTWVFPFPLAGFLSKLSPRLFSPGITLVFRRA